MADKCETYYCSWKRDAAGKCVGWEIRRPSLQAKASNPVDLLGKLGDVVGEFYDDHEAQLHFDPPLDQRGDPAWYVDGLTEVAWNAGFFFNSSADTAFAEGRCPRCGGGRGPRTRVPLLVDRFKPSAGGANSPGSNEPPPCFGMPGRLMIFSEPFLNALTDNERKTFETQPVEWDEECPLRFFEIRPRTFIRPGTIKGLTVGGWRCGQCGRNHFSHGMELGWGVKVICRQEIPADSPHFFFVGTETDVNLYCSVDRWRSLAGEPWSRDLTGERLIVVDADQFDPNPALKTLDEITAR